MDGGLFSGMSGQWGNAGSRRGGREALVLKSALLRRAERQISFAHVPERIAQEPEPAGDSTGLRRRTSAA